MFDLDRWKEIWETIARNRKRSIMTGLGAVSYTHLTLPTKAFV